MEDGDIVLEVLSIGDKIDIKKRREDTLQVHRDIYCSQLIELENDTTLKITMPTLGTNLILLTQGVQYECIFYTQKGLQEGIFEVTERKKEGNLPIVMLEARSGLTKVQRREFYRLQCTLPLKYRIAKKDEKIPKEKITDLEWNDGVVLDLSGGGLRFVTKDKIAQNQYVQIKLIVSVKDEYRELYIYGEIINNRAVRNNVRLREYRVQFDNIAEVDQDSIVAYIFEEERKKITIE